ncbi:transcriptional regulator [Bacillus nakamurai]|uniref:Transcriptional regulator n=1 Tax=Bacillus nakamurai TaxID=1793963 RepID=A0A150F4P5_9BACI|nr:Rrf2 family transcriptional regulator [Bacillus nakamurai]KXZ17084.1 transcriptional regulator [Bacillus nakamurai]KXZ20637.1 transcriptional regulator [Bacillus nakamurai]MCP6680956.1 Rrf2 family transcriptional regulator [Bacillus nakamurai]MED1228969.1 Rrf2 family transcriptional regulator [Bacillus nakamurai]
MINSRLAVAIHILSLISTDERASSDMIAGSVNTNPVVVRRTISQLKKAGILTSRAGVPGASLKKDPSEISLLEVYRAVQKKEELFAVHDNPNPDCPVGKNIQQALDETFGSVQRAMENELASKSLYDVMNHLFC